MLKINREEGSYELEYPCRWVYKVIGRDAFEMRKAIAVIVRDKEHSISLSNNSATGKYCCLNVEMLVDSEEQRTTFFTGLKNHPEIAIVL